MLVAIAGAQGSGKSTVLKELAERGYNVVQRKTARSILNDYPGKSLDDIYAIPELAMEWQTKILQRKIDDEYDALMSHQLWFTERTYADLVTYAVMAVGKNNAYNADLNHYYDMCKARNQSYLHTFYLRAGLFAPVADGVRGINKHYSRMIDLTMFDATCEMLDDAHLTVIETAGVANRVQMVLDKSIPAYKDALRQYADMIE
jgi:predicted ATPase